jgi:hypothetical protein
MDFRITITKEIGLDIYIPPPRWAKVLFRPEKQPSGLQAHNKNMKFSLDCALIMVVYGTHIKLN